jgi:thymidylate synthase (FAD)
MFEYQTARLIAVTKPVAEEFDDTSDANDLISYCARVSNPSNQTNFDTADKLLKYCVRKKHWSIFEMADLVIEIQTTRDIGRQLLRHTFKFQELSQRYATVPLTMGSELRETRMQDPVNRQNSIPCNDETIETQWHNLQNKIKKETDDAYEWAIKNGIAKECARVVLPEGLTMSRMYAKGNLRTWFHYCSVRSDNTGTQKEHVDIANKVWEIVTTEFPFINTIQ